MALMGVKGRYLRHKIDGAIFNYNEILAQHPLVEEVSEEVAFPAKFVTTEQKERKSFVSLETPEEVVEAATEPKNSGLTVPSQGGNVK